MSTREDRVTLRIQVRPSPETNDHEVLLFGDDQNLVERFGDSSIGLDPDDILVDPCPLIAQETQDCLVGRCDCGVIGCGDVRVRICTSGDVVSWAAIHGPRAPVLFDRHAYRMEVLRALSDCSWETPERTASRLIREGVNRDVLRRFGFAFSWASGRADPGLMTAALLLEPGPYQVLVRVPCGVSDSPELTAEAVINLLAQPPSHWFDVMWLPQAPDLGEPAFAGPGWRRG